jgi:uncharacterized protein (DUF779 family)
MPQVEVGFGAVIQNEHFSVLVGAHCAGVYVDVWVELLHRHFEPALFEQAPNSCSGNAFANRTDHTAGEKDVLNGHWLLQSPTPFYKNSIRNSKV